MKWKQNPCQCKIELSVGPFRAINSYCVTISYQHHLKIPNQSMPLHVSSDHVMRNQSVMFSFRFQGTLALYKYARKIALE